MIFEAINIKLAMINLLITQINKMEIISLIVHGQDSVL